MEDELPEVELTEEDLVVTPRPAFMKFAETVSAETSEKIDTELLARTMQVGMSRCKTAAVKRALIASAGNLHSPIARLTRNRIGKMLPPELRTAQIENIIIQLGSIAAQVPELWDLVTPD